MSHGDGGDAAHSGWPLEDGTVDGTADGALVVQPMVPSPLSPMGITDSAATSVADEHLRTQLVSQLTAQLMAQLPTRPPVQLTETV